jgi:hypothetical protein
VHSNLTFVAARPLTNQALAAPLMHAFGSTFRSEDVREARLFLDSLGMTNLSMLCWYLLSNLKLLLGLSSVCPAVRMYVMHSCSWTGHDQHAHAGKGSLVWSLFGLSPVCPQIVRVCVMRGYSWTPWSCLACRMTPDLPCRCHCCCSEDVRDARLFLVSLGMTSTRMLSLYLVI